MKTHYVVPTKYKEHRYWRESKRQTLTLTCKRHNDVTKNKPVIVYELTITSVIVIKIIVIKHCNIHISYL